MSVYTRSNSVFKYFGRDVSSSSFFRSESPGLALNLATLSAKFAKRG